MANPSGRETHRGSRSVRAKAQPMEIGTARIRAMIEVWMVPSDDRPGAVLRPAGVGHPVGVHRVA